MVRVAARSKLTGAEYLAWERTQADKHEFHDGDVFAMAAGSRRRNWISGNLQSELRRALAACFTFTSDQRIAVDDARRYVYPDTSVVCGDARFQDGTRDVLINPTLLIEILSESTEQHDRGLKWEGYQRLTSLTDYVLVSQREVRVEHFRRDSDGGWRYQAYGPGEQLALPGGAALDVDAIYYARAFELPGD